MNVIIDDKDLFTNLFYGFEIKNDTLILSEVSNKLRKGDFKSQTELLNFFNENIEREDFFVNHEIMIRK